MRRSRRKGQLRRTSSMRRGIALDDQNLFLVHGSLRDHLPERIGDERRAPEFQPVLRRAFVADAIHRRDVNSVGDRMRALNGPPRVELRRAVLLLLAGMPADRGRIKQNVRALQRGEARALPDTTGPSRPARRCGQRACRNSGNPGRPA